MTGYAGFHNKVTYWSGDDDCTTVKLDFCMSVLRRVDVSQIATGTFTSPPLYLIDLQTAEVTPENSPRNARLLSGAYDFNRVKSCV